MFAGAVLLLQLLLSVWLGSRPCIAAVPAAQRAALVDLYTSTNGTGWTNSAGWLTGDPCTDLWSGVACIVGDSIEPVIQ